jgi:hypothetical protein
LASKIESFFYRRLQYRGSVDLGEREREQPIPQSLDILHRDEER